MIPVYTCPSVAQHLPHTEKLLPYILYSFIFFFSQFFLHLLRRRRCRLLSFFFVFSPLVQNYTNMEKKVGRVSNSTLSHFPCFYYVCTLFVRGIRFTRKTKKWNNDKKGIIIIKKRKGKVCIMYKRETGKSHHRLDIRTVTTQNKYSLYILCVGATHLTYIYTCRSTCYIHSVIWNILGDCQKLLPHDLLDCTPAT